MNVILIDKTNSWVYLSTWTSLAIKNIHEVNCLETSWLIYSDGFFDRRSELISWLNTTSIIFQSKQVNAMFFFQMKQWYVCLIVNQEMKSCTLEFMHSSVTNNKQILKFQCMKETYSFRRFNDSRVKIWNAWRHL